MNGWFNIIASYLRKNLNALMPLHITKSQRYSSKHFKVTHMTHEYHEYITLNLYQHLTHHDTVTAC